MLFVMGVCGCGKTTIGRALSKQLQLPFLEGDLFHSQENIKKMSSGEALNDDDRIPWLKRINVAIGNHHKRGCVVACSALKASYREILTKSLAKERVRWFFLQGSQELILKRLQTRKDHFMSTTLLASQFDALEITSDLSPIAINQTTAAIVEEIIMKL